MKAFSDYNPDLQLYWDASSLKAYQFCPRYYQQNNLQGWKGDSTDLTFGRHIASGFERFQKMRLDGFAKEDAILAVVRDALVETYTDDAHQWGGHFETMWKCEGTTKYKNQKGNAAKCPFSHKRIWMPGDAPDVCCECGSGIIVSRRYVPENPNKNRITLIRALIWYGLSQPDDYRDSYHPYVFPDGTKAVELSGKLPLPWYNTHGEQYMLTWNFDYIGELDDMKYITDNKTTKKTLNDSYYQTFSPDTQFDTYALVGTLAYPGLDIQGVMVEGVQMLVGGVEFGLRSYYKNEEQHEEHFADLQYWIMRAEEDAERGYWPMNKRNCWLCPFKQVCSRPPSEREGYLKANFVKGERWDPAQER